MTSEICVKVSYSP